MKGDTRTLHCFLLAYAVRGIFISANMPAANANSVFRTNATTTEPTSITSTKSTTKFRHLFLGVPLGRDDDEEENDNDGSGRQATQEYVTLPSVEEMMKEYEKMFKFKLGEYGPSGYRRERTRAPYVYSDNWDYRPATTTYSYSYWDRTTTAAPIITKNSPGTLLLIAAFVLSLICVMTCIICTCIKRGAATAEQGNGNTGIVVTGFHPETIPSRVPLLTVNGQGGQSHATSLHSIAENSLARGLAESLIEEPPPAPFLQPPPSYHEAVRASSVGDLPSYSEVTRIKDISRSRWSNV